MKAKIILTLILFVSLSTSLLAADRYWVASTSSNWNNTDNWSTSSGGSGGASVPGTSDYVRFDAYGSGNCNVDITVNVRGILLTTYTGIIDLNGNKFNAGYGNFLSGTINDTPGTSSLNIDFNNPISSAPVTFGSGMTFGTDVNCTAPVIRLNGATFNEECSFTKITGANYISYSDGGCTFAKDVIFTEMSTATVAKWEFQYRAPDTFLSNVTFIHKGLNLVTFLYRGSLIDGALNISLEGNSKRFYLGRSLSGIVNGPTTINITTAGSPGTMHMGSITFNNDVTINNNAKGLASEIWIGNSSSSNIVVNGAFTFNHSPTSTHTGKARIGYRGTLIFNGLTTINNNCGSTNSHITMGDELSDSLYFNDNLVLSCTHPNSDGIWIGTNHSKGSRLAANKTVSISSGGFIAGDLLFSKLKQVSATSQILSLSGTANLAISDCEWEGDVNFKAPGITTGKTIYSRTTNLEKTGVSNDDSKGSNVYNGNTTIANSGDGYLKLAAGSGISSNDYNADATFIKSGNGALTPAHLATSTFAKNINLNTNAQIIFGVSGTAPYGGAILDGTVDQNINDLGNSPTPLFGNIHINKPSGKVNLNMPVEVSNKLELLQGIVNTTTVSVITLKDNATVSAVSDDSHIDGPIEKIGNDAFTFPVGDNGVYRPISISRPQPLSAKFRAEYFNVDPSPTYAGNSLISTIGAISSTEYWSLDRTASTSDVNVTLSWKSPISDELSPITQYLVAGWDGAVWQNHGNGGTTGTAVAGTVTSSAPVSSFGPFTIATCATTGIDVQNACESYTWTDGITYTENNNTATHTLTNAAGCDSVVTLDLTISKPMDITITEPAVNSALICGDGVDANIILGYGDEGYEVTLDAAVTGGIPTYSYNWVAPAEVPTCAFTNTNTATPTFDASFQNSRCVSYVFELTVTDSFGCTATQTVTVKVVNVHADPYNTKDVASSECGSDIITGTSPNSFKKRVVICHTADKENCNGNIKSSSRTRYVKYSKLDGYLQDGDCLGGCNLECITLYPGVNINCDSLNLAITEPETRSEIIDDQEIEANIIIGYGDEGNKIKLKATVTGGVPAYNYKWIAPEEVPAGAFTKTHTATPRFNASFQNSYSENYVFELRVTDGFGCTRTETVNVKVVNTLYDHEVNCNSLDVTITEPATTSAIVCDASADANIILGYGDEGSKIGLDATVTGGVPGYKYKWIAPEEVPVCAFKGRNKANAKFDASFQKSRCASYVFKLRVKDSFGCIATETVTVKVVNARANPEEASSPCDSVTCCSIDSVVICQNGNTIKVKSSDVDEFLQNGACLGACNVVCTTFYSKGTDPRLANVKNDTENLGNVNDELVIKQYPNPFTNNSTIEFTSKKDDYVTIQVFDTRGVAIAKLYNGNVKANQLNSIELDGENLAPGTYVCKVISNSEQTKIIKFIKL